MIPRISRLRARRDIDLVVDFDRFFSWATDHWNRVSRELPSMGLLTKICGHPLRGDRCAQRPIAQRRTTDQAVDDFPSRCSSSRPRASRAATLAARRPRP
jgi:hypothetical protein